MFDSRLQPLLRRILDLPARGLVKLGISANAITLVGLSLGGLAFIAISFGWMMTGLGFIIANRLCDGLDGAVARRVGPTPFGSYLDIVCDFVFYAAIPLGFAVADSSNALAAAFVIFSFMGTSSSFLAFAILAAKHGITDDKVKSVTATATKGKGFYYAGGAAEGAETIVFLLLICLLPDWFAIIAIGFGILCLVTTFGRLRIAAALFD